MFGYSKKQFNSFITSVEDSVAFVTVIDEDLEKSYMEIPVEDLKNSNIECKAGIIFSFTFRKWLMWEKVIFIPSSIKRKPLSEEEINHTMNLYEKYKDL